MLAVFILICFYSDSTYQAMAGQSSDSNTGAGSQQGLAEGHGNGVNSSLEILWCDSIRASYQDVADMFPDSHNASAEFLSCDSIRASYERLAGKRMFLSDVEARMRIIGGQEAHAHSWPWQVILQFISMPACGGAILTPHWVLSARHCFLRYSNAQLWRAIAGKHDLENREEACQQISKISEIYPHKGYSRRKRVNDVALLKLETPLRFSECVRPITIVTDPKDVTDLPQCTVTGWGSTKEYGPRVQRLQEANITILSRQKCSRLYGSKVTEDMICAGDANGGIDACQGDSGGPLSCYCGDRYKLAGVVSWGLGCGRVRRPGVYTNLQRYSSWIGSIIEAELPPSPGRPKDKTAGSCGTSEVSPCGLSSGFAEVRQAEDGPRVEGVSKACPHSWPWQVSLQSEWRHCCSGTLIHRQWVLAPTSCNCDAQLETVVLGAHKLWLMSSHPLKVKAIHTSSDLMLIQIKETVHLDPNISPVCLPAEDSKLDESWSCVTTGWEMGAFVTVSPNILHQARLKLVNESSCKRTWGDDFIHKIHLCADPAGSVACMGNSGGPLLCRKHGAYHLFGLMTWSSSHCNASSPTVFTRVSAFLPWIKELTKEN